MNEVLMLPRIDLHERVWHHGFFDGNTRSRSRIYRLSDDPATGDVVCMLFLVLTFCPARFGKAVDVSAA